MLSRSDEILVFLPLVFNLVKYIVRFFLFMMGDNLKHMKDHDKLTKKEINRIIDEEITRIKMIKNSSNHQIDENGRLIDIAALQMQEWIDGSKLLADKKQNEMKIISEEEQMFLAMKKSKMEEEKRKADDELIKLNLRETELEHLTQKLTDKFNRQYNVALDYDFEEFESSLNEFEKKTSSQLFDDTKSRTCKTVNGKSSLILEIVRLFKERDIINPNCRQIIEFFKYHIWNIEKSSQDKNINIFDPVKHCQETYSQFSHKSLENKLVPILIKGDGNCLWNSVSVALFGDYNMMESLRLLTARTLLNNQDKFTEYLSSQKIKFGYSHELTFEDLVRAATELQVWGDELHIMALSLALRRPIYSYGSLNHFYHCLTYGQLKKEYEAESYINHFKYVADTLFENQTPIMLYYNGENHYNVVLPIDNSVSPLVPLTQILDPLIDYKSKNNHKEAGDFARTSDENRTCMSLYKHKDSGKIIQHPKAFDSKSNQNELNKENNLEKEVNQLKDKLKESEKMIDHLKNKVFEYDKENKGLRSQMKKVEEELEALKASFLIEQKRQENMSKISTKSFANNFQNEDINLPAETKSVNRQSYSNVTREIYHQTQYGTERNDQDNSMEED